MPDASQPRDRLPTSRGELPDVVHCDDCGKLIDNRPHEADPANTLPPFAEYDGALTCLECAAHREERYMDDTGKATLYLTHEEGRWVVADWTALLVFYPHRVKQGRHNFAGTRYDVWFYDRHQRLWHGVRLGNNEALRCKRTKQSGGSAGGR